MSTERASAGKPSSRIAAATRPAASRSRSATATRAPERAASRAVASPIPEAPPITTTSLPSSAKGEPPAVMAPDYRRPATAGDAVPPPR